VGLFCTVVEIDAVLQRLIPDVEDNDGVADCVFELDTEPDTVLVVITLRVLIFDADNVTVAVVVLDLLAEPEYVDELVVLLLS